MKLAVLSTAATRFELGKAVHTGIEGPFFLPRKPRFHMDVKQENVEFCII